MSQLRVAIAVTGFTSEEVMAGLSDLREEFQARPWLAEVQANWDAERACLLIVVESAGEDVRLQGGDVGGVLDEVSDCVISCLTFSGEKIAFHVDQVEQI